MKLKNIIGLIAVSATAAYFLMPREENDRQLGGIEINPSKLVDGVLSITPMHPIAKETVRAVTNKAINKYVMGIK